MVELGTIEEWQRQSALLLQARPTSVRYRLDAKDLTLMR